MPRTTADPVGGRVTEVGPGLLSRASAVVYRLLVLQLLFWVSVAPGLALAVGLGPDSADAPWWYGLALLPLMPALSAVLWAWSASSADDDLAPGRHFWRGYRTNVGPVLVWWLPLSAVGTIAATDLARLDRVAAGATLIGLRVATVLVLALVAVAAGALLLTTTYFTVRAADLLRLLARQLRLPGPTLGALALAVCCLGAARLSGWLLPLVAVPAALVWLRLGRRVLTDLRALEDPR